MEEFLDVLWFKIVIVVHYAKNLLDAIFDPLNVFGPAFAVFTIALITVVISKLLSKTYKTRRYQELQKQFVHWFHVRQEARKCDDPDKANLLAKNIDQAKLNELYYNYFFEGLLNNLATKYLPIFILLTYVNEAYQPTNLSKRFGREYIFKLGDPNGKVVLIGAVFWFVLSLLLIYPGWHVIQKIYTHYMTPPEQAEEAIE